MQRRKPTKKQRSAPLVTVQQVTKELTGESDRACAIVAGTWLDDYLERLLEAYLIEHSEMSAELFGSDFSPLGSFGARIRVSYGVGLLNGYEYGALKIVQKIRNRFAHDLTLSFDDSSISDCCKELAKYPPIEDLLREFPSTTAPRPIFTLAASYLAGTFQSELEFIEAQQIKGCYSAVLKRAFPKDSGDSES